MMGFELAREKCLKKSQSTIGTSRRQFPEARFVVFCHVFSTWTPM